MGSHLFGAVWPYRHQQAANNYVFNGTCLCMRALIRDTVILLLLKELFLGSCNLILPTSTHIQVSTPIKRTSNSRCAQFLSSCCWRAVTLQISHQPPCPFLREVLCGWYFWMPVKALYLWIFIKEPGVIVTSQCFRVLTCLSHKFYSHKKRSQLTHLIFYINLLFCFFERCSWVNHFSTSHKLKAF